MSTEREIPIATLDESFPKALRLLKRSDFRRTERRGRRSGSRHFVVYARRNEFDFSRLGITVSRKVGNAVCRNRWKRRIREMFRRNKGVIPQGFDFVVIVKRTKDKQAPEPNFDDLLAEFLKLVACDDEGR